jgi:phosphoribosylformylglycinamidine (FGAM) synthase-like enzyme
MQTLSTKKLKLRLGTFPHRRVRGRIEGAKGYGNPIGRPTISTSMDLQELPPTKEHIWAGPWT